MSGKKYIIAAAAALAASSLTGCRLAPRFYTSEDIIERHLSESESDSGSGDSAYTFSGDENTTGDSAYSETEKGTETFEAGPEEYNGTEDTSENGNAADSGSEMDSSADARGGENSADSAGSDGENETDTGKASETADSADSTEGTERTLSLGQLRAMYGQDFTLAQSTPSLTRTYPLQYLAQDYVLTDYSYLHLPEISDENVMNLLRLRLSDMVSSYSGNWSVYVRNLSTNEEFVINDTPQPSASVMKLFVMGAVYRAMENGTLERTDEIMAMLSSMITYSSNTDANELLLRLGNGSYQSGIDAVNDFILSEGYNGGSHEYNGFDDPSTVMNPNQVNVVSAVDVGTLLARIYRRSFASRAECNEIEEWMLNQDTRYKIPRGLPDGVPVGNKTGETSTTENDAAVIYGPECDYILVVLSNNWEDEDGGTAAQTAQDRIAEISSVTYSYLNEDGAQSDVEEPDFLLLFHALAGEDSE